jgi:hypothetical protein
VHRKFELTARQAAQMFGEDNLSPKMSQAYADQGKCDSHKFRSCTSSAQREIEPGKLDYRGKAIASRYIAIDEKFILRRGGFSHDADPGLAQLDRAQGRNTAARRCSRCWAPRAACRRWPRRSSAPATRRSIRRSLFFDDGDITKLVTKPGGLNPGLVNEDGRLLVQPIPSGGNHGIGRDMQESERQVVKTAFLEDFFRILTDPGDRWTATQVLEMVAKQGVLIGPFADRYETEKVGVLVERVLDILLRAGQIAPMPPEMTEAGAYPAGLHEEPAGAHGARRRGGGVHALGRDRRPGGRRRRPEALDRVDFDAGMVGVGEVLGVRPSWILSDDELAAAAPAARAGQAGGAGRWRPGHAGGGRRGARPRQGQSDRGQLGQGGGLG